ncbi:MAG: hypothetical protein RI935_759 [Candidatus Parcubacteria bacterium]|jgi:hypothetical protein
MKHLKYLYLFIIIVLVVTVVFFGVRVYFGPSILTREELPQYIDEVTKVNTPPAVLQNFLVDSLSKGINDDATKSAAYWISHRYFDTDGDIYEIYDFIQKNPSLSFLQDEARAIYPESFQNVEAKLSAKGGRDSFNVWLAYMEGLEKNNLLALPGLSTLANKYIEGVANFEAGRDKKQKVGTSTEARIKINTDKSLYYATKAEGDLVKVMAGDVSMFATKNDAVVALTQYATTLQFYKLLGIKHVSPYSADAVYDKARELSVGTTLNMFTSFVRATMLVKTGEATSEKITEYLSPIMSVTGVVEQKSFVYKIINAKTLGLSGIYSYENIRTLANKSEKFKGYLESMGWTAGDFREPYKR